MWNDKNTQRVLVGAAALFIAGTTAAQVNEEVNSRPDPYVMDPDFFKMPEGRKIGATVTLVVEQAMQPEGPWSSLLSINQTVPYTVQGINLSAEDGAANQLLRFIRWHIESTCGAWKTCFRINARATTPSTSNSKLYPTPSTPQAPSIAWAQKRA